MKPETNLSGLNADDLSVMRNHPLFSGLTPAEAGQQLAIMNAETAVYEKGATLQATGAPMNRFGIVLSGAVQVCEDDIEGNRMIMAEVTRGRSFGESLCFLQTKESPVYIFASEETKIVWLSTDAMFSETGDPFYTDLQRRFTAALAEKNLTMNSRIQVLSKLSLRGKLTAYFTELAATQGSNVIHLPMNRDDTAAYIGANRSALSRELARMKAEGFIDYRKNEIVILTETE